MPKRNGGSKKSKRNRPRNNQKVGSGASGLPVPSSAGQVRLKFNPDWNPQCLKVKREFQYSAPSADFGGGFGIVADPSVGCSTTLLSYSAGAYSFRVGDVYNVTEFGNLFDQYRIAAVKLRFDYISSAETVLVTTAASMQQVTLIAYEDFDDSTAPTGSNTGWQAVTETGRQVRKVFPNKTNFLEYTVYPKYLVAEVDNSGGTTGRGLGSGWLDGSTSPDVIWRGVKWIMQANPAPVTVGHYFRVTATYFLQFRNRQ